MIQRQQNLSEPVPSFYIRTLVNLETSVNTTLQKEKEAKKKMNATNAKALTAMKQKVKKALKENEVEVKKYLEVCHICGPSEMYNIDQLETLQDPEAFEREYQNLIAREAAPAVTTTTRTATGAANETDEFTTVGKGGKAQAYTSESIFKDLQAVQEARGKKVSHHTTSKLMPVIYS
jgi:translation initiation factor 3 subunit C